MEFRQKNRYTVSYEVQCPAHLALYLSTVRVVYSDACDTGYGGYVLEHGGCISHGWWSAKEAKCSSTGWELPADRVGADREGVVNVLMCIYIALICLCISLSYVSHCLISVLAVYDDGPTFKSKSSWK